MMKSVRSIFAFAVGVLLFIALGTQALAATTYTVKAGDWLSKIAKAYGVTVEQLKQYNSLKSDTIYVGQNLIVSADTKYVVKKGDSLWLIASRHSTTIEKIKTSNNLKSEGLSRILCKRQTA